MDKRDYHAESPFDSNISKTPHLKGSVEISANGNITAGAGGSVVYGNSVKTRETSLDIEVKKNNETEMFLESESVGVKLEHKGINESTGVFFDTKGIASYTSGQLGGCEYTQDRTAIVKMNDKMTEDARKDLAAAGFDSSIIDDTAPLVDESVKIPIYKINEDLTETKYLSTFFKGSVSLSSSICLFTKTTSPYSSPIAVSTITCIPFSNSIPSESK